MKINVYDDGDDVLRVEEVDKDGTVLRRGSGWLSAMTNHFDPEDYDHTVEGSLEKHLRPDATPREMAKDEKEAYIRSLLPAPPKPKAPPKPLLTI